MGSYGCRIVGGRLVIRSICDREVGQSRNADGWRLRDGGCRNDVWLWGSDESEWRGLRNLRFEVRLRKTQGCCDGSCSEIFLVLAGRFWFAGYEFRRRRKTFPVTLP